ncbi:MAG TPA: CBS domain-containing protein [Candidatus Omnitrophica bacterium]|nr:CBS domain-containing protein [Candidatus Omnitrophota bacterium]
MKVSKIMTTKVVKVEANTPVKEICRVLISHKVSGVPVVDGENNLLGFVSERDIISKIGERGFLNKRALEVMNKEVLAVDKDASSEEVTKIFMTNPYRYIPVVKKGKLVGIISRKDLIDHLMLGYY